MNYELAKELKDAGFPQMGDGMMLLLDSPDIVEDEEDQTMRVVQRDTYLRLLHSTIKLNQHSEDLYAPILTELIEACKASGGYFGFDLQWNKWGQKEEWTASLMSHADEPKAHGTTPEEAVARLYIALQKTAKAAHS